MTLDASRLCQDIVHGMNDAVVYCNAEGVIEFWNPGAERIFGFSAAEAVGNSMDIIIPEAQRAAHWRGYHAAMETGTLRYGPADLLSVPARRKDGTRVSIEFTVVLRHDDTGKIYGIAAVMRDITKRFEEMRALRRQVAELTAKLSPAD